MEQQLPERWKSHAGRLTDAWGHEYIYRCPAVRKGAMFDFYSMGPNGIDEYGEGDDVNCGAAADYETYKSAFWKEEIDLDYVRSQAGPLKRGPDNRIIGIPVGSSGGHP